ncbi:hypothetical protein CAEBREN_29047 [Caenorhabditis brenneri]|uniref:G-protein coupled receptors family 1 profile domain-containing protein n=1 Tax=Caenorhabditis brenneri TaxID=135651 RepID=G0N933_CAEBE|nr:hypothetical protein CAEBREN_29047 [Caenorhabditis brenneri]
MFEHIDPYLLPLAIFFFFCSTIGVIGNSIMISCCFKTKRLRSPCHFLISLTCLIDAFHISGQFPFIYQFFTGFTSSQSDCYFILILPIVGYTAGGPLILAMGIDRYIAVTYPTTYRQIICANPLALNGTAFQMFTYSSGIIYVFVFIVYLTVYILLKSNKASARFKSVFRSLAVTVGLVMFGWVSTTTANTLSYSIADSAYTAQLIQMYAGITVNAAAASNVFVFYAINSEYREVIKALFGCKSKANSPAFEASSTMVTVKSDANLQKRRSTILLVSIQSAFPFIPFFRSTKSIVAVIN